MHIVIDGWRVTCASTKPGSEEITATRSVMGDEGLKPETDFEIKCSDRPVRQLNADYKMGNTAPDSCFTSPKPTNRKSPQISKETVHWVYVWKWLEPQIRHKFCLPHSSHTLTPCTATAAYCLTCPAVGRSEELVSFQEKDTMNKIEMKILS